MRAEPSRLKTRSRRPKPDAGWIDRQAAWTGLPEGVRPPRSSSIAVDTSGNQGSDRSRRVEQWSDNIEVRRFLHLRERRIALTEAHLEGEIAPRTEERRPFLEQTSEDLHSERPSVECHSRLEFGDLAIHLLDLRARNIGRVAGDHIDPTGEFHDRRQKVTDAELRAVWQRTFGAEVPDSLSRKKIFEACLAELSPERLREELWLEKHRVKSS